MRIDPKDPAHHDKPMWVVYGEQCMPSVICAKLRAYTSDHVVLPAGQEGPVVCIWGYSVFKRVPGFRTLGSTIEAWARASGSMKPVFFDRQEEALGLLRKLTTPKPCR